MSNISLRSSILKNYVPNNREKIRQSTANRVRFDLLNDKDLRKILEDSAASNGKSQFYDYIKMIQDPEISNTDFLHAIEESRQCIDLLQTKYLIFVESLLAMDWTNRTADIALEYQKFLIDLLSAHSRYIKLAIEKLILYWLAKEEQRHLWEHGTPTGKIHESLTYIHEVISAILDVIPMSKSMLIDAVENQFPYFTRPSYVLAGYVSNIFWLIEYQPIFKEYLLQLLFKKLIIIDVNVPKSVIEEEEEDIDDDDITDMFAMDDISGEVKQYDTDQMRDEKAETLDICMEKMFTFIDNEYKTAVNEKRSISMVDMFIRHFDSIILPTHNSHHVQFVIFYLCSFKISIADTFLRFCWEKFCDPNNAPSIRQAAIGYVTSLLARAKYIPLGIIKDKLQDMCNWVHQYIQRCDSAQNNTLLRAHLVFHALCQSIFYIISFRSRDLTNSPKNLLFLNSLQLSTIVSSQLNPLQVCRPEVATAFAGVTRAYQLAYCHTILERNARIKLALVYSNGTSMPADCLDTCFPFDPYLLKKSGKRIEPIYMQYQASDAEEGEHLSGNIRRKRIDSPTNGADEIDDFIVDKKQKITELSLSFDRELQFNHL